MRMSLYDYKNIKYFSCLVFDKAFTESWPSVRADKARFRMFWRILCDYGIVGRLSVHYGPCFPSEIKAFSDSLEFKSSEHSFLAHSRLTDINIYCLQSHNECLFDLWLKCSFYLGAVHLFILFISAELNVIKPALIIMLIVMI